MSRRLRRSFAFLLAIPAVVLGAIGVCGAQSQSLMTRHVRQATRTGEAQSLYRLPTTESLTFDVVLALRHQPELANFLQELYDPSSPSYRHFVTVQEFTARFGPSQEDYDALIRFAEANGFTVLGGSRDAMDMQLKGSVAAIERAFHVSLGLYQHPTENRTFYAPDREPTADLPFQLWHISGLDNYSIPHSALAHRNVTVKSNVVTGSCPSASYCGSDMRAAYYGGTALTGAGQTLGLLEFAGYDIADVNTYFKNAGQTNSVTIDGISIGGATLKCLSPNCDDTEQTLDITQAVSMAPGLSALHIYVGNTDTAILSSMSTRTPLDAQLSSSWTWEPADTSTDDPFFQKFAAQGQSYFQAAGDSGSFSAGSSYVFPADDDYVTTVGGTDLQVTGPGGAWSSETTWIDGGGGYYTPDAIPIPAWQQLPGVITTANKGSKVLRNAPDVSAEANFDFYVCADQEGCTANEYGGTSFAAPMWAAYIALVNQQAVASGNPTVGFINPAIYSLGLGTGYQTDFHDITSGDNGAYSAIAGFDLATGWGSPNGVGLINALTGSGDSPNFALSASPNNLTVVQGNSGTSTITITPANGFSSAVTLSATGLPSGVTAAFSPNPATSTSTLTLTASATSKTGAATLTVKGVSGSLTNTTTLSLTVNATAGSPAVTLKPTSLTWGAIKVGTTGPERTVNVTNSGTATLDITSIKNTGDFAQEIVPSSCGSTLAPGKTCHIEMTFTPTATGARTGTLTITDNAAGSPQTVPLAGTGK
jgi:subtilase family serine protease